MIRIQRLIHRWLWVLLALAALSILALAVNQRPDYPVEDPAVIEDG